LLNSDAVIPYESISSFSAMTLLVGYLTRKIVSEMTYNVSSGMLNTTIPHHTYGSIECRCGMKKN